MPHVMVISSEGYFYSYSIDLENGGECTLMKQYRCVLTCVILTLSSSCSSQHVSVLVFVLPSAGPFPVLLASVMGLRRSTVIGL